MNRPKRDLVLSEKKSLITIEYDNSKKGSGTVFVESNTKRIDFDYLKMSGNSLCVYRFGNDFVKHKLLIGVYSTKDFKFKFELNGQSY